MTATACCSRSATALRPPGPARAWTGATSYRVRILIVHEPTFYSHQDETKDLNSEIYRAKQDFIDKNKLVIFRFHDHWHARKPDGVVTGVIEELGWDKYQEPGKSPALRTACDDAREACRGYPRSLEDQGTARHRRPSASRFAHDVFARVYHAAGLYLFAFDADDVDVLVMGETQEWTGVELARDSVTLGRRKGLIILGHVPSEEAGMKECAKWLKTFVPEVPIEFIPSGEPFWIPK